MRSSNPVLKRAMKSGRYGQPSQAPYGQGAVYQQQGYGRQPYEQSYQQGYPQPGQPQPGYPQPPAAGGGRLTIDDVVMRTGMTLGVVILGAAINYFLTLGNPGLGLMLTIGGALGGLVLGLIIAFKQSTNSALILTYAALEGLFVGGISWLFESMVPNPTPGSLVVPAVFGTLFVAGGMLALYKFEIIRVTNTFVKVVSAAAVGLLVLLLANFALSFFIEGGLGLRTASPLGMAVSVIAIVIAALILTMEFKNVDDAIAMGMPEKFSWQLAFGLTVTLVWLYVEILRLLWMIQTIFSE